MSNQDNNEPAAKRVCNEESSNLKSAELNERESLELRKLKLEIGELEQSPRRAAWTMRTNLMTMLLSLLTTLFIGIGGWIISLQIQRYTQRQHDVEVYADLLKNLGATNVPSKVGAVVGLARFALDRNDLNRSAQTITTLITQLTLETDPRVIKALMRTIVEFGEPALEEVASANRSAHAKFVTDVRALIADRIPSLEEYKNRADGTRGPSVLSDARDVYGREVAPVLKVKVAQYFGLVSASEQVAYQRSRYLVDAWDMDLFFPLAAGEDETFGLTESLFGGVRAHPTDKMQANIGEISSQIAESARVLFVTSLVLGRMVRRLSGQLEGRNLEEIALLVGDLRGISLGDANMRRAYLAGDATGADFSGAHLEYARLSGLLLDKANLSFATLWGTMLPDTTLGAIRSVAKPLVASPLIESPLVGIPLVAGPLGASPRDWRHTYLATVNLTGADWWDSAKVPFIKGYTFDTFARTQGFALRDFIIDPLWIQAERCPAPETKTAEQFSISFCQPSNQVEVKQASRVEAEGANLEEAFPSAQNDAKRKLWLKRVATVGETDKSSELPRVEHEVLVVRKR